MARKPKKPVPRVSTLNPVLARTTVHDKTVALVRGAPKVRRTRDVEFEDGSAKRLSKEVLQDYLLLRKGYLPKYSDKPLEYFEKRGATPSKDALTWLPDDAKPEKE